ncbi:spirocyclase AveC family protein [Actinomycetospora sp. TBRC 11914]|uniref:spirocyclase AveC family protein n=1 Tax=Actinomycetospora sp. TBRC 11914 TaxID=2729387 RepID=UPI00145FA0CE|nr:spirocyclase AveC family protein [Actinomycetospora sp. TBRC 11914]NMO91680.1 spirocyclase AveC family protein [Actinomycetospora sp. TBRC 11914]
MTTSQERSLPSIEDVEPRRTRPVNVWAVVGAVIIAFEVWVLIRWVSGPYFVRVDPGPTEPPMLMRVILVGWQVVSIPIALGLLAWFVIRPWMRDRRVGVDGILVVAFLTMWWQDPISSYGGHWFDYNSWMINFGSWVNSIPGWLSYGAPGHMLVEPILFTPGAYSYIFVIVMFLGSWFMRKVQARFPRLGKLGMIGALYVFMMLFDFVLEGILWLPMGIFHYAGGYLQTFPDSYFAFPLHEALSIGATFTAVAALRYYTDDKGQTLMERGSEDLEGGEGRKVIVRCFAAIAAVQVAFLLTYNVPNFFVGIHSDTWNEDTQKRSYFMNGLCGTGTDRACPGPTVPLSRGNSSYAQPGGGVDANGNQVPANVPFSPGG